MSKQYVCDICNTPICEIGLVNQGLDRGLKIAFYGTKKFLETRWVHVCSFQCARMALKMFEESEE